MSHGLSTRLIHAGSVRIEGAVTTPTFSSATYTMPTGAADDRYEDVRYVRLSNSPSHRVLRARLASAEGAADAAVTASGMAAISTALLAHLSAGDHLLAGSTLYGGTATLLTGLVARLGITVTFIDVDRPDTWAAALRPRTRLLYLEAIANPRMTVGALPEAAAFARQHGLLSVVDSTFATPVNFRPLEHGFDLVLHSATKYLNGHSDLAAGVIAGSAALLEPVHGALAHLGGCLDPHACTMLERGLKTLTLRMRQHNANAAALAAVLAAHPAVEAVLYPGLPSSPGHAVAAALFDGFGGMLALTLAEGVDPITFLDRLELAAHAPSLGGVETLVVRPAASSHLGMTPEERAAAGISDGLIRVSVGIEDAADITADFSQALSGAAGR